MAKDIGVTIRKSIVVSFLPCLVAFLAYHPYMFFHFLKCFFVCYLIAYGKDQTSVLLIPYFLLISSAHAIKLLSFSVTYQVQQYLSFI